MNCPPLNELLDYARQLLTATEREQIELHLQTECRACAENMQWVVKAATSSAQHPSYVFSEDTLQGLVAWFRSQPAHESRSAMQFIARLLFDSFAQPQWAAARSGVADIDAATERQMLFQTDGYDIDLRFESSEDQTREDLIGQVLPQSTQAAADVTVELRRGEQTQRRVTADAQGYFKFAQIPRGAYDLKIHVPEGEINLAQVTTMRVA